MITDLTESDLGRVMRHVHSRQRESCADPVGRTITARDTAWLNLSPDVVQEIIITYLRHRQEDSREETPGVVQALGWALGWYEAEARAIATHADGDAQALMAAMTVLALDGGKRARAALATKATS